MLGNIVVLVFLAAVIGLGVRSLATGDTRFGWGMFSHQADWSLSYSWVLEGGELEPFEVPELGDRLWYLEDDGPRSTRYGIGAVRSWVRGYLEHLYSEQRPDGAVGVQAELRYAIDGGPTHVDVLTYPEGHEVGG